MLTWAWLVIRKSCWEAPGGQAADLLVPLGPVEAAALVWRFTLTASVNKHLTPRLSAATATGYKQFAHPDWDDAGVVQW